MRLWCKLRRSRHSTLSAPHCCCPLRPLTREPDLRSQNCFHRSLQPWRPLILCRCTRRRTRPSSPCITSVHVRLSDDGVASTDTAALGPELRWLRARAQKRLAVGSSLYIASNVPMGVRSAALAPLCSGRGSFNCSDQGTLHAQETQTWRSRGQPRAFSGHTRPRPRPAPLCQRGARVLLHLKVLRAAWLTPGRGGGVGSVGGGARAVGPARAVVPRRPSSAPWRLG